MTTPMRFIAAGLVLFSAVACGADVRRPQEEAIDRGPVPYQNENVTFENPRAHLTLAGTFSVPQGKGPFPAILLVAGAGPMDRDEGAGHRFFLVHADNLLRRGI